MITCPIKNTSGETVGEYSLDPSTLVSRSTGADGAERPLVSKQLLHDAVVMYEANRRVGTVKTKSRGEVAGSTKKLFRQKGTGNARMGPKRTPVRRGGGHTFAKRPKDWGYRLPKKALRLATRMALLSKFQDSEAVVLDELAVSEPKTKPVAQMLSACGVGDKSVLVVTKDRDQNAWRSTRNIAGAQILPASDLNADVLLRQKYLLITKDAIDSLTSPESDSAGDEATS